MISRRQFIALGATISATGLVAACSSSGSSGTTSSATGTSPATDSATTGAPASTDPPATAATELPTAAAPTTVEATTTTVDLATLAMAYSEVGPHPVGVTTLALAKGPAVEVWYPAVTGTTGSVSYDVRDFVPDAIRALLTTDIPARFSFAGARDAVAADGSFPVVLFSHGFSGFRLQSTFLTAHLASWGFVVAAPDHPSRDLSHVLLNTASGDRDESVNDLLQTLELVVAQGGDSTALLSGHANGTQVVAVGHSAGGGTIVGAALDPRIAGYISLASGVSLGRGDATATTVPVELPDTPSFFIAGALDGIVSAADVTRPSFESVPTPTRLWVIDGVGHNGFDDFCTFGNGTGIIGVAEASGLGALLDAQPQLKALGQDGCLPPAVPVEQTFPIIRHAVTAWIRALFGVDAEPVGLDADVAGEYAVAVTIDERL